jgi:hypothetical protein
MTSKALALAVLLSAFAAPAAHAATGYCETPAVTDAWAGKGKVIAATPTTLPTAVQRAAPGDTVELVDGTYYRASVTLTKPIRLKAAHPLGAIFVGGPTPRFANDTALGPHVVTAVAVRAGGTAIEGIDFRYYDFAVDLTRVAGTLIQGNRILSPYFAGIHAWDSSATEVRCNQILDPYLAQDPVGTVTSAPTTIEAQADYGVAAYGTRATRVEHNYFFGVFNQTVSFKEGNWDPYVGFNTFEGSALTALFFGQNVPHNGPYLFTGLPTDNDRGKIVAEDNAFREVYGERNGVKVAYYLRSPIRVWHVNGDVTVRDNVVEQAAQGILLECRAGPQAGCVSGSALLADNTIAGQVRDPAGLVRQVNTTAGVLMFGGLHARTTIDANAFALLPRAIGAYSDGVPGPLAYLALANRAFGAAAGGASLDLRAAAPATDPDLAYASAYGVQE